MLTHPDLTDPIHFWVCNPWPNGWLSNDPVWIWFQKGLMWTGRIGFKITDREWCVKIQKVSLKIQGKRLQMRQRIYLGAKFQRNLSKMRLKVHQSGIVARTFPGVIIWKGNQRLTAKNWNQKRFVQFIPIRKTTNQFCFHFEFGRGYLSSLAILPEEEQLFIREMKREILVIQ